MDYNKAFDLLTPQEFAVIYWKSQEYTHMEVGDILGWGLDNTQRIISDAHLKLGLGELLPKRRETILKDEIYPALREWIKHHKEVLDNLRPPLDPLLDAGVPPGKRRVEPYKDAPIQTVKNGNGGCRWRVYLFLAGVAALIVLVGAISFILGQGSNLFAPFNTIPSLQALDSPAASIETPLSPTPSLEPTLALTDTPVSTNTPVPTATTNPNIFLDDFSDVLDPAWTVVQGKPVIVNGELTVSETTVLSVGDASWKDYEIQFDILVPGDHCALTPNSEFIGIRASDLDNMLMYAFTWCDSEWRYLTNGNQTFIPNTNESGFKDDHVTFRVEGNQVILHRGSKLVTSLVNEDFPTGNIFLKLARGTLIDNFKVTLLNQ